MSKEKYIKELKKHLKGKTQEDINSAIIFVEEYYDELNDEKLVFEALGTPFEFSQNIIKDTHFMNSPPTKQTSKNLWLIILAVLSAPISIPLVIVALSLIFVGMMLLASLFIIALSGIILGISLILVSIRIFFVEFKIALYLLSLSLIISGTSLFLSALIFKSFKTFINSSKIKLISLKKRSH